ncbi:hypothetical protein SUGI_0592120 [Cryptomeria japonica]|nr:hypothetical protein SUGI_0592120 [Cryptomeria japonica]
MRQRHFYRQLVAMSCSLNILPTEAYGGSLHTYRGNVNTHNVLPQQKFSRVYSTAIFRSSERLKNGISQRVFHFGYRAADRRLAGICRKYSEISNLKDFDDKDYLDALPKQPMERVPANVFPGQKLVHSTAIVHSDAVIGEGVTIGPFCIVGQAVKLGNNCQLHAGSHIYGNTELGYGCVVSGGAIVGADLPGRTVIGNNNFIGYHAVVGAKCQDLKYMDGDDCFLYIGNNNDIREYASIHRSSKSSDRTVIGDNNLVMGSCHIAHDCKVGNHNIFANSTIFGGHVVVENYVHTGGIVGVHQFCHIGSHAFLAAGTLVARDVPMYMMVAGDRAELRGLNLEGLRRHGFSDMEVRSIRRAYQKLFMCTNENSGLEERLAELENDEELGKVPSVILMVKSVQDCFKENRRGICKFKHWT